MKRFMCACPCVSLRSKHNVVGRPLPLPPPLPPSIPSSGLPLCHASLSPPSRLFDPTWTRAGVLMRLPCFPDGAPSVSSLSRSVSTHRYACSPAAQRPPGCHLPAARRGVRPSAARRGPPSAGAAAATHVGYCTRDCAHPHSHVNPSLS
jgi:hypothetical protein